MLCDVRHSLTTACATALLLSATMAQAGSYLQSEGDLNYSIGVGYLSASREWDNRGELQRLPCRNDYLYNSHYLEYGYSYYYTLFGGTNLAQSKCGAEDTTGVGDVRVGLRGRLDQTRNHRAWQLELNIPTSDDESGRTRLGCGVVGLAGSVARKDDVSARLTVGAEAGLQLWDAPLLHQVEGRLSASGAIGELSQSRWNWNAGLSGHVPLEAQDNNPDASLSDCGTQGKSLRGSLALGYRVASGKYLECGNSLGLWGVDTTKRVGFFCGYSHRWKR